MVSPVTAFAATCLPTAVEPVKEIRRGTGWVTKASPISEPEPTTTDSTPAGSPASSKTRAIRVPPVTAVSDAGLRTTALPSASAGATERWDRCSGKFHGEMTPTTPTGLRYTRVSRFGVLESKIFRALGWGSSLPPG